MQYIDEKFKEANPVDTVERINGILKSIGINVNEKWYESGLDNCITIKLSADGSIPFSCGKGITRELSRASAYGEFIERLQGGLFYYKFQSSCRDPELNIHTLAPDAKYMTTKEVEENGEWMDYIIDEYKSLNLDRANIAEQCRIYSCADDDKILMLPFYSLFEKKHVYLPINFVDQIYATNGCCVGNTKTEAWVHAFSELMERHANLQIFTSGKAAPKIPDEVINQFPVVANMVKQIKDSGEFDIEFFDYSIGNGLPVICVRIINKKNHSYKVNVGADPVLEIAIERTITEIFQGLNLTNFMGNHGGKIINKLTDFPLSNNIINQLETSNGIFTADYFANELTCTRKATDFADNSCKTNEELLEYLTGLFKQIGKPVYIRNFSFLGFPCYRFVIPGFSEAYAIRLGESVPEYAIADSVTKTYRSPKTATTDELTWLLSYANMTKSCPSKYVSFSRNSGIPITTDASPILLSVTRAYAAYKTKQYNTALRFIQNIITSSDNIDDGTRDYMVCINKYVELKSLGVDDEKIKVILGKFFLKAPFERLYKSLENGGTPYDEFLMDCDFKSCDKCKYKKYCSYENCKRITRAAGEVYKNFVHGQDHKEFEY